MIQWEASLVVDYSIKRYDTVCEAEDFVASCVDIPKFLGFCRECRELRK